MLPNLFVIGAPKCGTTSLAYYLSQHPDIYVPSRKEIHFFDDDRLYDKTYDFYKKYYAINDCVQWRVDATPNYMPQYSRVIPRIVKYANKVGVHEIKFIVLIRDPVYRAWSHYLHMKRNGYEPLSFNDALGAESERLLNDPTKWYGYFTEGLYSKQLVHWFEAFGRENFFIIRQDDLSIKPSLVLLDVFEFLGIRSDVRLKDLSKKNVASRPKSILLMKILAGQFLGADLIRRFLPMASLRDLRMALRKMNTKVSNVDVIPEDAEKKLRVAYREEIEKLEQLLGCDFSDWKKN